MTAESGRSGSTDTEETGDDDDGYVHRPSDAPRTQAPTPEEGAGWRGWVLLGAIVVVLLVIPGFILYLPEAQGVIRSLGLTLRDAYLTLPLLPAFLLGVLAVWAAVRSRSS